MPSSKCVKGRHWKQKSFSANAAVLMHISPGTVSKSQKSRRDLTENLECKYTWTLHSAPQRQCAFHSISNNSPHSCVIYWPQTVWTDAESERNTVIYNVNKSVFVQEHLKSIYLFFCHISALWLNKQTCHLEGCGSLNGQERDKERDKQRKTEKDFENSPVASLRVSDVSMICHTKPVSRLQVH